MKEVKLPSGAVLKIQLSPFVVSKALYQAILKEVRSVSVSSNMELSSVYKDIFCIGFSSPQIEACVWDCLKRCTYNDLKIDQDTFEQADRREDYTDVCVEVVKENILPFVKGLMRGLSQDMQSDTSSRV